LIVVEEFEKIGFHGVKLTTVCDFLCVRNEGRIIFQVHIFNYYPLSKTQANNLYGLPKLTSLYNLLFNALSFEKAGCRNYSLYKAPLLEV
jgi:hypothetical protein